VVGLWWCLLTRVILENGRETTAVVDVLVITQNLSFNLHALCYSIFYIAHSTGTYDVEIIICMIAQI